MNPFSPQPPGAPGKPAGLSKMMVMLPMFFVANKITFTDELVSALRIVYICVQILTIIITVYIKQTVEKKKDKTKISIPKPPNPFQPEGNTVNSTTYYDHEKEQVAMLFKQTAMGIGMVALFHLKMGMKPVLLMQSVMGPMNLLENPLIKKHFFNSKEKLWGETLEGEEEKPADKKKKAIKGASTDDLDEQIKATWDEGKQAHPALLMKMIGEENINYQTKEGKWTALMILSGLETVSKEDIKLVLKLGADRTLQDEDGYTALHWAADKDSGVVASVLTEGDAKEVKALLELKDKEGLTALALAKDRKSTKALAAIEKATARIAAGDVDEVD